MSDFLSAGRVGRAHGLDGSFHVTRPRAPLLVLGGPLRVGDSEHEIVRRAGTDERPIVRVDGVESREAVEALRGAELSVPRTAAPQLDDDEYWPEDLEGCSVTDGDVAIGTVRRLIGYPSVDVLEVERPDGPDLLVPMVHDAIRTVDVAARRIDVSLEFLGETP
ncbi:MAG TPA: ribosome maturation factor RimM [Solirubrobacteraceae bacterium]|nr:ribosome maturation factor RimM [Solirubrobacteraceae bacterium]